jgi:hypothetical protein
VSDKVWRRPDGGWFSEPILSILADTKVGPDQKILHQSWEMASGSHCRYCKDGPSLLVPHELTFFEVFLDTLRLYDHSNQNLPLVDEPEGKDNRKIHGDHELERLRGFVNTITIRLGDASSLLMRQASHLAAFPAGILLTLGTQFHRSDSTCLSSSTCAGHKKQTMEIRCKPEELSDCRLWSILRIIEGMKVVICQRILILISVRRKMDSIRN